MQSVKKNLKKTRGIDTSESLFVACFGVILGTGIFGNFGTGRGDFPVSEREFSVA